MLVMLRNKKKDELFFFGGEKVMFHCTGETKRDLELLI